MSIVLLAALKRRAFEFKDAVTIGRSHGIHAEPTTFGVKLAGYYAEFVRARARLVAAREEIAVCRDLGRGRHLRQYRSARGSACREGDGAEGRTGLHAGDSARPARGLFRRAGRRREFASRGLPTEIRHLQRTEVLEAEEYFSEGQKGSSAMPHKRNPVLTENLTGLARMVRAYVTPALEDVALWHERDISHSSVERYIGPDATITLDFALARAAGVVDKLLVYPERMKENLDRTRGLVHSQRVLLALTQAGVAREDSYRLVQRNAMRAWNGEGALLDLLKADKDVTKASRGRTRELFDLGYHLKHVDTIFERVFGQAALS